MRTGTYRDQDTDELYYVLVVDFDDGRNTRVMAWNAKSKTATNPDRVYEIETLYKYPEFKEFHERLFRIGEWPSA